MTDIAISILKDIGKMTPVFGMLILAILYFYRSEREHKEDMKTERTNNQTRIDELNLEIRENEKANIETLTKLADALDKLSTSTTDISKEMKELKHELSIKLMELKSK